jgi:nitroreductase
MPDALQLLLTRRTIPALALKEPGPTDAEIETLLTAAIRVPDHGKLTPWRFILIRGEARHRLGAWLEARYATLNPQADAAMRDKARMAFSRAPVVIAVVSTAAPHVKIPEWEQVLSAGASTMTLVHAAHAMGFSAQWLTEWYGYDAEALAYLGVRAGEKLAGFVHIGTPSEPPVERPRPAPSALLSEWVG